MKTEEVAKKVYYTCDRCGKRSERENEKWVILYGKKSADLFLIEKNTNYKYETFQIPAKKEVHFCSITCARDAFIAELDIFLASSCIPINVLSKK